MQDAVRHPACKSKSPAPLAAFPAQSLADIAAKCAKEKEDYELAVATVETTAEDAERLAAIGPSPELVALADRVVSGIAAYSARAAGLRNFTDHPECKRIFADYREAWDALAAFPSRNPADIVEKLRAAEPYFSGSDTGELCEMLWADCRRLHATAG